MRRFHYTLCRREAADWVIDMTISMLVIIILAIYLLIMAYIGYKSRKHQASFESSITASKATTALLIAGSSMGLHIGSGFIIGGAEYGATYGIGGAWYGIGCGLSSLVSALLLTRYIYRHHYLSLSDYFLIRYKTTALRIICIMAGICCNLAVFAGQLLAGRAIFYVAGIKGSYGIILTAVIALVFTQVSGLWGTMVASLVQSGVILVSVLFALIMLVGQAPVPQVLQALPDSFSTLVPFSGEVLAMMTLPNILSHIVSQLTIQRIASARSEKDAVHGYLLGGLLLLPVAFIPALIGIYGRYFFPNGASAEMFSQVASSKLPMLLGAMLLSSVICAVLSSCNAMFISVSTNIVHDVCQEMFFPEITDRQCRRLSVIIDSVICVIGIMLAFSSEDIIQVISLGYTFITAGAFVPFVGGILWKGGNKYGAVCGAIAGILCTVFNFFGIISVPYASVFPILPAAIAFVIISLITQKRAEAIA